MASGSMNRNHQESQPVSQEVSRQSEIVDVGPPTLVQTSSRQWVVAESLRRASDTMPKRPVANGWYENHCVGPPTLTCEWELCVAQER